jgi:hypothetical protein
LPATLCLLLFDDVRHTCTWRAWLRSHFVFVCTVVFLLTVQSFTHSRIGQRLLSACLASISLCFVCTVVSLLTVQSSLSRGLASASFSCVVVYFRRAWLRSHFVSSVRSCFCLPYNRHSAADWPAPVFLVLRARPAVRTCVALVHGKRACPKRTTHELLSFSRRVVPAP